ncbi:DUF6325 family protein [Streptomyces sp. NPDC049954]|uniref:DUF6325 family protein n=1 Tax=Streptomyces sp. NPDC049954 TaxID=3155779 RepID=UPI00344864C2
MRNGLSAESVGPVDVAVVAFEGDRFNGEIVPALRDLRQNDTVRILDMTFVRKAGDGSVDLVELADPEVSEAFHKVTDARFDLLSEDDMRLVADGLAPGSSAVIVAWENTWAARLGAAIRDSHGEILMLERIPRDTVVEAVNALDGD